MPSHFFNKSISSLADKPQFNPRSTAILAVAKAANMPLDIVTITSSQDAPDSYRKLNPLGKIPTFVGSNGFVLSECIAIAIYSPSRPLPLSRRQTTAMPNHRYKTFND